MCGGVRYWHPPRILTPAFCHRSIPLSTPHTAAFKRYDSFNDRDFVEKSDFQNLGFKLYWLDILLHPVLCGIFWLEKFRFYSKITDQLIVSWSDHVSPRWVVNDLYGCYGYQNDHEARLILIPAMMSHIDDTMTKLWCHNWIAFL